MKIPIKVCPQCKQAFCKPVNESRKNWEFRRKYCSKACKNSSLLGVGVKNGVRFEKGCISLNRTHNLSKTRFYSIWLNMKRRCYDPSRFAYPWYGGRGIKVTKRWHEFTNFQTDMFSSYLKHVEEFGEKQTTLDRKNSLRDYSKSNCRWATLKEQGENRRRNKPL